MGNKVSILRQLVEAFGGTVSPEDDTVCEVMSKLVNTACKSYEVKVTHEGESLISDKTYDDVIEALDKGELPYVMTESGQGGLKHYHFNTSYTNNGLCGVIFTNNYWDDYGLSVSSLYILNDGRVTQSDSYIVN